MAAPVLFTLGYEGRTRDELVAVLQSAGVTISEVDLGSPTFSSTTSCPGLVESVGAMIDSRWSRNAANLI